MKSRVIELIYTKNQENIKDIEIHEINDSNIYCFYINDYSFHIPVTDFNKNLNIDVEPEILTDFVSNGNIELTTRSLKDSLIHLQNKYGVNANDKMEVKKLRYPSGTYFIGWKYLDDSKNKKLDYYTM